MTDEKKREYTLRITQAGPKGLTILLYEITECYLQEAEEAFARKEPEQFRDAVHKAQKCLTVCRSSLDRTQPLSAVLLPLYVNLHAMLSRALTRKRVTEVQETAQMIAQLREAVDAPTISVSVMQSQNGKIAVYHTYRALGRVLRDAGFRFPALIDDIPAGQRIEVSAERLPELDADYIFATYRSDTGGVPADEIAAMNGVMPGFCDFLRACGEGRYILLPREEAISNSYAGLALMVAVVQSQISGRQQGAELRPD